jgi:hypothetical protein
LVYFGMDRSIKGFPGPNLPKRHHTECPAVSLLKIPSLSGLRPGVSGQGVIEQRTELMVHSSEI